LRGTLADDVSYTGCEQTVSSVGFVYDSATSTTYQACFSNTEVNPTSRVVSDTLTTTMKSGIVPKLGSADGFVRQYIVVIQGQQEAAYRINLGSTPMPIYVYCTSRGIVDDTATSCLMNSCGDTTGDFIVFGDGPVAGAYCFHTCYTE